jgi:GntR family transcriptional regulator/MocR family aminotransferase
LASKSRHRSAPSSRSSLSSLVGSLRTPNETKTYLHRQLFGRLKHAIISGQLQPGARLPSTRRLAAELNISRNTIVTAYELLDAEGLVESQIGGGTTVSALSERRLEIEPHVASRKLTEEPLSSDKLPSGPHHGAFKVGIPAYEHFPMRAWSATINRSAREQAIGDLACQDPAGHIGLRRLLAAYLLTRRGLRCDVEQIVVVPGYQAGLNLVVQTLLERGDQVWIEDPGHVPTRDALRRNGIIIRPVPVDSEGIVVDAGIDLWPGAKLAVVTPAHQFPLGMALSQQRRRRLLSWARSSKGWIVEDDYDTEFHFVGKPPDSLAGAGGDERVIYIGTFSKVLYPSLRIGYVVVPPALVERFSQIRRIIDGHQPHFMQAVVHRFIEDGHFDRHVGKMRALYRTRQRDLVAAITDTTGGRLRPIEAAGGTHLTALFDEDIDDVAFTQAIQRAGVEMTPLTSFRIRPGEPGLVIGFSNCPHSALDAAMSQLHKTLSSTSYSKPIAKRPQARLLGAHRPEAASPRRAPKKCSGTTGGS